MFRMRLAERLRASGCRPSCWWVPVDLTAYTVSALQDKSGSGGGGQDQCSPAVLYLVLSFSEEFYQRGLWRQGGYLTGRDTRSLFLKAIKPLPPVHRSVGVHGWFDDGMHDKLEIIYLTKSAQNTGTSTPRVPGTWGYLDRCVA